MAFFAYAAYFFIKKFRSFNDQFLDQNTTQPDNPNLEASDIIFELEGLSHVKIKNQNIEVQSDNISDAKIALKQLKHIKKLAIARKREIIENQRLIRESYTNDVRTRSPMIRGGKSVGRFIRSIQSANRNARRTQFANDLNAHSRDREIIEKIVILIDNEILKTEAKILQYGS